MDPELFGVRRICAHANIFLCVWLKHEETRSDFCVPLKSHLHLWHAIFHVQSSVLDPPHPALLTRTSHGDSDVILGILPNVRITRNHQGADLAKSVLSRPTG